MQGLRCSMWDLPSWGTGFSSFGRGLGVALSGPSCPGACGIFIPGPETEPTAPALEGGFLTTGPPGSP